MVFAGTIRLESEADGASWNVNSLTFNPTAGAFILSGAPLSLAGSSVTYALANNSSNLVTLGNALALGSSQSWHANTGALALDGTIALGANTLTLTGASSITSTGGISGTGALVKSGTHTLTLSGANTYTGGTTVSAGTLRGNSTSLQGNIVNQASLVFEQAAGGTYAGVVSGSGALTKLGAGTLALSGVNTYTGATQISAGTLALTGTNTLADVSAVSVAAGATLQLGAASETVGSLAGAGDINLGTFALTSGGTNASTTFSGTIAGTGSLIKAGTGTLTLTGPNTYSGGTTVSAGTLQGSTSSLQGNIVNNAGLVFDQSTSGSYGGSISGTGSLTKQNTGTLTLTGTNTYTGNTQIAGGTLALGAANALSPSTAVTVAAGATFELASGAQTIASIAGGGSIALGANTLTTGGSNASTFFSGVLSGTGALQKTGTGTLTLTGTNAYTGGTTVSAGTLAGTTTSLQGNIVNQAAVIFDQSTSGTYAGVISGVGSLTKQGAGTVTLSGANTFTGGTTIAGGSIALAASNVLAATGALTLNSSSTLQLAGHSLQVGTLAYHTAIIDFGSTAVSNAFLLGAGGASSGTLTINNYAAGDILGFQSGASGVVGSFVNGIYFYGIGGGVLGGTGQSVAGYSGLWDFIVPDVTPFKTWSGGGGNGNWNTAGNWADNTTPVGSTSLKLSFTGATGTASVMNGSYTVNTLRFETGAAAFTLSASGGGSTLTFGGSVPGIIQLSSNTQTLALPIALGTTTVVETTGAGSLALTSAISGSGGLTKVGDGTLLLGGSNTYTGTTTINAGTVVARHSNALGSTAAGTTVSAGAVLQLENNISIGAEALALDGTLRNNSGSNAFAGAIGGSGTVVVDAGTLTLSGTSANSYSGNTTVNSGQLDLAKTAGVTAVAGNLLIGSGAGAATVRLVNSNQIADTISVTLAATGTPIFNLDSESETIGSIASANATAQIQLGAGTLTTGGDHTSTTFAGVISGTGTLVKQGSGTFTLTGPNTYTGATTIAAGTLVARHSSALGTAAGGVSVAANATLQLENSISIGAEALTLNGTLRSASGFNSYAGAISGSGGITLNADTLTLGGTAANTFTGTTAVQTGQLDLAKSAGLNAVSGNLVIGDGSGAATVRLINANQIGNSSAVTLAATGTPVLNLNNQSDTIGSLASANAVAAVQLGSATLSTGADNTSTTFAGVISGTGSLTKQGTGTFTLSGANTYSGATTVSAGTLALANSNVLWDSTNLTLGSGSTLSLSGTSSERINILNFTSATIDFGPAGTTNHFLFSSAGASTGTLTIANWSSDTDIFGVASNAVSQSFLDNLFFSNLNVGIGAVLSDTPVTVGSYGSFYTLSPIPTFIWDGGMASGPAANQDDWNQAANWTGNIAPAVGAMKAIVMAGSARLTNDLNGAYQINSLLFRSDAGAFTLSTSTGDTLTIGGGGINNQSTSGQTINVPISLSTAQTWTAGSGNLTIGGATVLNGAHTLTFAGDNHIAVSAVIGPGSGGLVKNGTGTLTLSGANTFTGGVTLNAGTVSVGSDIHLGAASGPLIFAGGSLRTTAGLTSARAITLNSGGGTIDSNGFDATFSGPVSGSGGLTKSGVGTLTLTGSNSYSGGTTVNTGTLRGSAASLQGNIVNHAAVTFDQASDGTFAGAISGAGSVTKLNSGTLVLTGTNSYTGGTTVSAGTLQGSATSLQGNIVNQSAVVFEQTTSGSYAGVMSGAGTLTKLGAGSLTLTAISSYTGATNLLAGTLTLGASNRIASTTALTISSGATFDIAGHTQTLGSLAGAGTVALGSGGTLSIGSANTSTTFGGALTGTGVLEKIGTGSLTFNSQLNFAGELRLTGGTVALAGINLTVGTLRISGNTILDFGLSSASVLTASHLIIENNATLTITNWVDLQDFFYVNGTLVGLNTVTQIPTSGTFDSRGSFPLNQVQFNGFAANTTIWQSGDRQITPAPEPATYGALMATGALAFFGYRNWRKRRAAQTQNNSRC